MLPQESPKALLRWRGGSGQDEVVIAGFQHGTFDEEGAVVCRGVLLGRRELEMATDVVDEACAIHTLRQLQTSTPADISHPGYLSDEGARNAALGWEPATVLLVELGMRLGGRAVLLSVLTVLGGVLKVDGRRVVGAQAVELRLGSPGRSIRRWVVTPFLLSGARFLALGGVIVAGRRSHLGVNGLVLRAAAAPHEGEQSQRVDERCVFSGHVLSSGVPRDFEANSVGLSRKRKLQQGPPVESVWVRSSSTPHMSASG